MAWWNKGQGQLDPVTGLKICSSCKTPKTAGNFHHNKYSADDLTGQCVKCKAEKRDSEKTRIAAANWRAANPEAARTSARNSMRKWRETDPERAMLRAARYRAERAGISFTITESDIRIPKRCPVRGCHRLLVTGDGKNKASSPSLDRYNPSLGYSQGNIWVICQSCNSRKQSMTGEEFIAYGTNLIKSFKEECERLAELSSQE